MARQLSGLFETRRGAEMAVERLVQEMNFERGDISITPQGEENSAGEKSAGSDNADGSIDPTPRRDAALNGGIEVAVSAVEERMVPQVMAVFAEFAQSTASDS